MEHQRWSTGFSRYCSFEGHAKEPQRSRVDIAQRAPALQAGPFISTIWADSSAG